MKVSLGKNAEIDGQELITGRTLLCSVTRYGKSWCARRITEQVFGHSGVGIIDLEGEYSTLLELYPFLIIGRDVPIEPEAAAFLADEILKNRLSFIIDGSNPDLDAAVFQEFVATFVNRFIAVEAQAKVPYLFILEESDQLIPEKGVGSSLCLEPLTRLVAKGGKRGLGTIIITQRPAFVSKRVVSQASCKLIGHIEWNEDIAVLRKFGQIPETADIKNLKQGYFYAAGPFIDKPRVIHIGPVKTTHLGATPSVIPPTPSELKDVVAQLAAKLPAVIEEMKPAIPKAAEIEARLKEKFEEQWKVRLQRVEKQRDSIRVKTEARYETEIADLKRKLEDASRQAAMKGSVSDLLSHPLVQQNLEKLNAKQRGLVQLLETKGPQSSENLSLFLETNPKNVPAFIHEVNRKIPKLVENVQGKYVSRLAKLFPVTEELQEEAKEIEQLRKEIEKLRKWVEDLKEMEREKITELADKNRQINEFPDLTRNLIAGKDEEIAKLRARVEALIQPDLRLETIKEIAEEKGRGPPTGTPIKAPTQTDQWTPGPIVGPIVPVEVQFKRVVTGVTVEINKEVLEADESSHLGKILARGLDGFFDEPKGFGAIMGEMERKYSLARTSGGSRDAVRSALEELVAKGILDRKQEQNQWQYYASDSFKERVREKKP